MPEMADILGEIVAGRRVRIQEALEHPESTRIAATDVGPMNVEPTRVEHGFVNALRDAPGCAVIAEVKMGSPRMGSLAGQVDPLVQAQTYADHGATCLSVVVEPDFFFGSYGLLAHCREASGLPTLAKDFVVHPVQLEWARNAGASAVLLIAAIVSAEELRDLAQTARELGLEPLVECHSETELAMLEGSDWEMVGVNNRDLRTFEVSLDQSIALLPGIPGQAIKVAESGIRSGTDVARLAAAGFEAFLVGETLLLADNPAVRLQELVNAQLSE